MTDTITGFDIDNQKIQEQIAHNTKAIAEQLSKINETLVIIRGMLELLYKNGLLIKK